jgi:acyl carrier protein
LADGYWRRPDLTAERFVLADVEGQPERLYRSGDRARYTQAGAIEFLGRLDDQVKIRGYRMEPAELEVALERHPGVRQAALVPRERDGTLTLAAFYTRREGADPTAGDLREFLRALVPDYMIPASFAALDAFPVTPSGKINRRGLLAVRDLGAGGPEAPTRPTNAIEEQLVAIWQDVLGTANIGTRDSFFELGGHSLTAVRVMGRIQQAFGTSVALSEIFRTPTVSDLAVTVQRLMGTAAPAVPAIRRSPRRSASHMARP